MHAHRILSVSLLAGAAWLSRPALADPGAPVAVGQAPGERKGIAVAPPQPEAPAPSGGSRWRLYTGNVFVGVAAVFFVTGIVSTSQVADAQETLDITRKTKLKPASFDWCSPANTAPGAPGAGLASACRTGSTFQPLQFAAYPLAAAFAGAGLFLMITHRPAESRATIVPSLGPRSAGLHVAVRF